MSIRCDAGVTVTGTTPARLLIPRRATGCAADVAKTGYASRHIALERGYNAAFWANFAASSGMPAGITTAFGGYDQAGALFAVGAAGALGFAVDRISGRGFGHDPDKIEIRLEVQR